MTNGHLEFAVTITDPDWYQKLPDEEYEVHHGGETTAIKSDANIWMMISETKMLFNWSGVDYIDFSEIWYQLERFQRDIPDCVEVSGPNRVRFRNFDDIRFEAKQSVTVDNDGVVYFHFGEVEVAANTTDDDDVYRLSSVRASVKSCEHAEKRYHEAADLIADEFTITKVI